MQLSPANETCRVSFALSLDAHPREGRGRRAQQGSLDMGMQASTGQDWLNVVGSEPDNKKPFIGEGTIAAIPAL